ncbi:MAG TPA: hypothetical protein VJS44_06995 [Pyrinomonadaceae bacterium]|nr:hypothetical protein [Pyrinomonadaceae bacterium]
MDASYTTPVETGRLQRLALIAGIVALAVCAIGALLSPGGKTQFFHAYLMAYVFWTGVSIGSLAIMMLHHLSGGGWGLVIRRIMEAATRVIPLMFILFLPLILGIGTLYEWAHPLSEIAPGHRELIQHKQPYLNIPFFIGRFVFYFAVWGLLTYLLNKLSLEQDRTANPELRKRMQGISGPGIVFFGLTVTFAATDWIMSLEPEWFSTIFGLLIMVGWGLSALAFIIIAASRLVTRPPLEGVMVPLHFHDLGKLLLAFVMLWAYFGFSQFLLIWYGNLPEEIPWYLRRMRSGWAYVGLVLVLFHFAVPFFLLLSRNLKRHARTLSIIAALLIVMRFVDLFWMIAPVAEVHGGGALSVILNYWMYLLTPIGIGGLWLAYFAYQLRQRALLPVNDKGMENLLEQAAAAAHHH